MISQTQLTYKVQSSCDFFWASFYFWKSSNALLHTQNPESSMLSIFFAILYIPVSSEEGCIRVGKRGSKYVLLDRQW